MLAYGVELHDARDKDIDALLEIIDGLERYAMFLKAAARDITEPDAEDASHLEAVVLARMAPLSAIRQRAQNAPHARNNGRG